MSRYAISEQASRIIRDAGDRVKSGYRSLSQEIREKAQGAAAASEGSMKDPYQRVREKYQARHPDKPSVENSGNDDPADPYERVRRKYQQMKEAL